MRWSIFGGVFEYLFLLITFSAYIFMLVWIVIDLFRDQKLNGWFKALWIVFLVFVPFITALVYLIARGSGWPTAHSNGPKRHPSIPTSTCARFHSPTPPTRSPRRKPSPTRASSRPESSTP